MQEAVVIQDLSKRYWIGAPEERHLTFREALAGSLRHMWGGRIGRGASSQCIWALRHLSLSIQPGEVVGIIGRNGAGKSSLLKVLSRITEPTEGRVAINGRVASLLEVGTGFHSELTGRENVFLNGSILGMSLREIRAKFDQIVAFSGVEQFLDTPVKRYSSGMQMRLAFAVAAHLEPEVLVIDEVLAVGDAGFQSRCLGKMQDVSRSGRTVIVVSHNMTMVRALCTRCILLAGGRMVMDDEPSRTVSRYVTGEMADDSYRGEVAWPEESAPGNAALRLRRVRLLGPDGEVRSTLDVDSPVTIEVTYHVRERMRGLRVCVQLLTQDGMVAFTTTDHDRRGDGEEQPGTYRTTCVIPALLLNLGRYVARVYIDVAGTRQIVSGADVLSFTASGAGNHGSTFPDKSWPGALAPRCLWSIAAVDDLVAEEALACR